MILPYLVRLACLSLACFFLVHLALAMGINWLAPWVLALAKRRHPSSAAGLLLAARLFPSVAAVLVVAGVCVPSYLWLEPESTLEEVGLLCLAAALASLASGGFAAGRALRAIVLSMRYTRQCRRFGCETRLAGEETGVLVMENAGGLFALAGILRPRLVISREVLGNLSEAELEAALKHECAHRTSRDNLKRLLLLLAPAPQLAGLQSLERGWAQFTEWAADDRAAGGDSNRSVSLAGALVRVARLGVPAEASPLMTSLVADGGDLEARVDRLLGAPPSGENQEQRRPGYVAPTLVLAGVIAAVFAGPATLQAAHGLMEYLIR
jgi:Zn-dependent protease with chaperone function